ncbi:MAG: response regulator transcription factor [Betaproteobacteria bacterium]|nr:response regulator transcription factor [Betaproteobacteria bacterium]
MKILLADDHTMFRESLKTLLEREGFEVVGEASDGREAIRLARRLSPDMAIVDLGMPILNGIGTAREIHKRLLNTRTILLTMFEEEAYVLGALQAGVRGYVLKAQAAGDLVRAINEVSRGSIYLSPGISRAVVDAYLNKTNFKEDPLTERELQVLQLIAEGKSTKEVAQILGVSFKTAESHRMRIMSKLDIHNAAGLVRYAIRRGLVQA